MQVRTRRWHSWAGTVCAKVPFSGPLRTQFPRPIEIGGGSGRSLPAMSDEFGPTVRPLAGITISGPPGSQPVNATGHYFDRAPFPPVIRMNSLALIVLSSGPTGIISAAVVRLDRAQRIAIQSPGETDAHIEIVPVWDWAAKLVIGQTPLNFAGEPLLGVVEGVFVVDAYLPGELPDEIDIRYKAVALPAFQQLSPDLGRPESRRTEGIL